VLLAALVYAQTAPSPWGTKMQVKQTLDRRAKRAKLAIIVIGNGKKNGWGYDQISKDE